ncbi:MAG: ATP synthase F1 subunit delta [Thermodesulfovibrionales bacterium]
MAKNAKNARKYARTLFQSVKIDDFEDALSQLTLFNEVMNKNRDVHSSLTSPLFSAEEKAKAVDVISDILNINEQMKKYLQYIVVCGMATVLPDILRLSLALYHEKKQKAKATVFSPVQITGDIKRRLKVSLKKITSKDIDVEYVNDPALLGGFIVKVGSTMYDSSIKGQLRLLKDELIKG